MASKHSLPSFGVLTKVMFAVEPICAVTGAAVIPRGRPSKPMLIAPVEPFLATTVNGTVSV